MLIPNPEKSMEDVWKDLSFFADHPTPTVANRSNNSSSNSFGDFLSFERDPVAAAATATTTLGAVPLDSNQAKKKRDCRENGEDTRRIRKVKNRESATRSRARKQAYIYELEHEVAKLRKENAKLRKQQQNYKDLFLPKEAPAVKGPKKHSLYRTLTAPF